MIITLGAKIVAPLRTTEKYDMEYVDFFESGDNSCHERFVRAGQLELRFIPCRQTDKAFACITLGTNAGTILCFVSKADLRSFLGFNISLKQLIRNAVAIFHRDYITLESNEIDNLDELIDHLDEVRLGKAEERISVTEGYSDDGYELDIREK
jgi:hypothetical protein